MPLHRLINIHSRHRWNIKARQPHIHHNCNFKLTGIILKFQHKTIPVRFVPNNIMPVLIILIAGCQNHLHFLFPFRPLFQNNPIKIDGNPPAHTHNHSLARKHILSVFIMGNHIIRQKRQPFLRTYDSFNGRQV